MNAHPIDRDDARFGAEAHLRYGGGGDDLAENVLALLGALAAAEHRATRAEAQSAIRGRAVVIYKQRAEAAEAQNRAWEQQYAQDIADANRETDQAEAERDEWRQAALDERAAALDALEQIKARDARIKAVRELHQRSAMVRRIPRFMREGYDDYQPFHYCTGCDGARYPCDTIRALDGDA